MTKRSLLALGAASAVAMVTGIAGAGAASTVQTGWWTTAPIAIAPDAPENGLVVQGGPDEGEPVAVGALAFSMDVGEVPESLQLQVATGSASTPDASLQLCALTAAFAPAQGGRAEDAPSYDCATSASAEPSEDGTSYRFDVTAFVAGASFAVAVLPTGPIDRVVLAPPTAEALTSSPSASGAASGESSSPLGAPPGDAESFTPSAGSGTFDVGAPVADFVVPALPEVTPGAPASSASRVEEVLPSAGPVVAADGSGGSGLPALLVAGVGVLAGGLWMVAGAPVRREQGEPV